MAEPAPILIAGGGIGGLALALALAKAGRASTVLEQRDSFGAAGAGIQLGPNGVRVLQRLGLAEALRPAVGVPDALAVHDGRTGRTLAVLPLGRWIAARHGAPYWVAHRGDLHAVLASAASAEPRITLRPGFALASLAQHGEVVQARSAAGDVATGAALVGADGLWSSVRRAIYPEHVPQFVGATATRTVIPVAAAGRLALPVVGPVAEPGRQRRALSGPRRHRDRRRRHRRRDLAGHGVGRGGRQSGPARAACRLSREPRRSPGHGAGVAQVGALSAAPAAGLVGRPGRR